MVACLKRLLPVGLNLFAGREQELVQHCKDRFLKKIPEYEITDFAKTQLTLPDKIDPADEMSWQHYLYSQLGSKKSAVVGVVDSNGKNLLDETVERIVAMSKVLYGLHMVRFYFIHKYCRYLLLFNFNFKLLYNLFSLCYFDFFLFHLNFYFALRDRSIIHNNNKKVFIEV